MVKNKLSKFVLRFLSILLLVSFGFLGGVLFTKRNHVPSETLDLCMQDFSDLAQEKSALESALQEAQGKFIQCVIYVSGVLEGRKGVKK